MAAAFDGLGSPSYIHSHKWAFDVRINRRLHCLEQEHGFAYPAVRLNETSKEASLLLND
ncbi:hypothetical protein RBWH47_05826 [Rhodopirellula baltica WH47]|uniref:Uncharacterized protein n=1 Tax=Rhodopirellula baltica WH47 TaxID=991778 RepID=F2AZ91_RHOBT|nr:hypothetical protein RBWH47_05826 [Rhodopirellula baltica WH47]